MSKNVVRDEIGTKVYGEHEQRLKHVEKRVDGEWIYVGTYPTDPNTTPDSPPLQNAWQLVPLAPLRFRWLLNGNPDIQGKFSGGVADTIVFTLPSKVWPDHDFATPYAGISDAPGSLTVKTNGDVIWHPAPAASPAQAKVPFIHLRNWSGAPGGYNPASSPRFPTNCNPLPSWPLKTEFNNTKPDVTFDANGKPKFGQGVYHLNWHFVIDPAASGPLPLYGVVQLQFDLAGIAQGNGYWYGGTGAVGVQDPTIASGVSEGNAVPSASWSLFLDTLLIVFAVPAIGAVLNCHATAAVGPALEGISTSLDIARIGDAI